MTNVGTKFCSIFNRPTLKFQNSRQRSFMWIRSESVFAILIGRYFSTTPSSRYLVTIPTCCIKPIINSSNIYLSHGYELITVSIITGCMAYILVNIIIFMSRRAQNSYGRSIMTQISSDFLLMLFLLHNFILRFEAPWRKWVLAAWSDESMVRRFWYTNVLILWSLE